MPKSSRADPDAELPDRLHDRADPPHVHHQYRLGHLEHQRVGVSPDATRALRTSPTKSGSCSWRADTLTDTARSGRPSSCHSPHCRRRLVRAPTARPGRSAGSARAAGRTRRGPRRPARDGATAAAPPSPPPGAPSTGTAAGSATASSPRRWATRRSWASRLSRRSSAPTTRRRTRTGPGPRAWPGTWPRRPGPGTTSGSTPASTSAIPMLTEVCSSQSPIATGVQHRLVDALGQRSWAASPGSSRSSARMTNSSPPSRATVSHERTTLRGVWPPRPGARPRPGGRSGR